MTKTRRKENKNFKPICCVHTCMLADNVSKTMTKTVLWQCSPCCEFSCKILQNFKNKFI